VKNSKGVVSKYQYLGLLLTEFLDYNEMAKAVARSAGRALSLLIVKRKHMEVSTLIHTQNFMIAWSGQ
jgi:hypothetical protein